MAIHNLPFIKLLNSNGTMHGLLTLFIYKVFKYLTQLSQSRHEGSIEGHDSPFLWGLYTSTVLKEYDPQKFHSIIWSRLVFQFFFSIWHLLKNHFDLNLFLLKWIPRHHCVDDGIKLVVVGSLTAH